MPTRFATATRDASCNAVVDLIDVGAGTATVKIYSGAQPATPNTAPTGTLLATFNLPNPAYGASSTGTATLLGVPLSTSGLASGDAGWFRVADRNGNAVFDGTVTAPGAGGQMEISPINIGVGAAVILSSGSFTVPVG